MTNHHTVAVEVTMYDALQVEVIGIQLVCENT